MAAMTRVSTKGQVILPKEVRESLDWHPGTRLVVEQTPQGVLLRSAESGFTPTRVEDVFGCLAYEGKPATIEDMKEAVLAEAKRRHARR